MNIVSPLAPTVVAERIRSLVEPSVYTAGAARFAGRVTARGFVIRTRARRFALPWRATFRGAALPAAGGTVITGKFDSNWSQYFVGYPVAAAVFGNIMLNVLSGRGGGRAAEFALFATAAIGLCMALTHGDRRDKDAIAAALCHASEGRIQRAADGA